MKNSKKYLSRLTDEFQKEFEEQMRKRYFEDHSRRVKRGLLARKLRLEMEKTADIEAK